MSSACPYVYDVEAWTIKERPRRRRYRGLTNAGHKRRRLFEKQKGLCWYCGEGMRIKRGGLSTMATFDHLVPRSRGGGDSMSNVVLACHPCNSAKKDQTVEEFRENPRVSLKGVSGRMFYGERLAMFAGSSSG